MARTKKIKENKELYEKAIVRVTRKYFDIVLNKEINPSLEFECSKERAKQLIDAKVAELVKM